LYLRFISPLALMALIFMLFAEPDLSTGLGLWDLLLRKLAHAFLYGALTLLWLRALGPVTNRAIEMVRDGSRPVFEHPRWLTTAA
jgi:hypothetical protein